MAGKSHAMHGRDHRPGGADPISWGDEQVTFSLWRLVGAASTNLAGHILVPGATDEDGYQFGQVTLGILWPFATDDMFYILADNDSRFRSVDVRISSVGWLWDISGTAQEKFGIGSNLNLAAAANGRLTWAHSSGSTFVDLTTATTPKITAGGSYWLSAEVTALWTPGA